MSRQGWPTELSLTTDPLWVDAALIQGGDGDPIGVVGVTAGKTRIVVGLDDGRRLVTALEQAIARAEGMRAGFLRAAGLDRGRGGRA